MSGRSVTVMGGGNTAFAVAASLTLECHEVTLFELPEFADSIRPIEQSRTTNLLGVAGVADQGPAGIAQVMTDAQSALGAVDPRSSSCRHTPTRRLPKRARLI